MNFNFFWRILFFIFDRKAKYTIGGDISDIWDDKKHSAKGEKYFSKEANKWYCRNCFLKFIERVKA